MLKKFFLNFLSSFAGAWVALGLFGVTATIVIFALIGKIGMANANTEKLTKHSILKITLDGTIEERETAQEFDAISLAQGNIDKPQTLVDLTKAIEEAKESKDIDMIYLDCQNLAASPATLNALRGSLLDFKKSGKKIYSYGDAYTTGTYYLASVADSIFVNPAGNIAMKGLGGTTLMMKDFFDKIGVEFEVVKVGTFKSAVEPYIMNQMSEPAKAQLDTLFGNMWGTMLENISASRKVTPDGINNLINKQNLTLQDGRFVVKCKLADKAVYRREMNLSLANAVDVDVEKLNLVSPQALLDSNSLGIEYGSSNQLAVVYATGEIMEGTKTGINCEVLAPLIVELADNDDVKGMVLRVNSPGGSVFGSEVIGEALDYFKSKGKPLAVSMGDYAASGGYWISCGADRIFADPLTITGSIGIFGLIPNVSGLAAKIGVNPEMVSTNPDANFPSLFKPLTPAQHDAMQQYVEKGYDKFISRVAKGRGMKPEKVRRIAEGRVWDASSALRIGLIDQLGSLQDACEWVETKAEGKGDLEVVLYPQLEPGFWDIVRTAGENALITRLADHIITLAPDAVMGEAAANVIRRKPIQARMTDVKVKI